MYRLKKKKRKLHSVRFSRSGFCWPHVDSGASLHVVSKKDFNKSALETVRISKNPTTVVTSNGDVLPKEEATVYVRELDLFVTVGHLENTPTVLSLGKLCEELGYS